MEPPEGLQETKREDIDKLLEKEEEIKRLKAELDTYKTYTDVANEGFWSLNIQKNQFFVTSSWKAMLGIKGSGAWDEKNFWIDLVHPEDRPQTLREFQEFLQGKNNKCCQQFRLRHADGLYRWIESKAHVKRSADGTAIEAFGSHIDSTEQKNLSSALIKNREKYRNLFQNSLVAMFRCDMKTGQVLEANNKFCELLDIDKNQPFPSGFDIFINERGRNYVLEKLRKKKYVNNLELQIKTITDTPIWVSFSAVLYEAENNIECILKDISQTKENLMELQKVNFELDSFVYHASHDLRSPLRSILGLIDLYRLEKDDEIKSECIEKIEGSVKRLDDLVVELLSISRNDRVNDPHVNINLFVEINNSVSSYYNAGDTDSLNIVTRVSHKQPFRSDLTRVRIILNNLISNAIKYRSYRDDAFVLIEADVQQDQVIIKVEDNGEGIEESKLPHIFDMFYRATEKSEGSGLGLYIVKKVADKLKAELRVESIECEGTKFTVTIPNNLNN